MFEKKCKNCGNKVERKFTYCPFCSYPLKEEIARKGLLDEELDDLGIGMNMPFQGIIAKLMKDMDIGKIMKDIERMNDTSRMMPEENRQRKRNPNPNFNQPQIKTQGISISIATSDNGEPIIKVKGLGDMANMNLNGMQQMPQKQFKEKLPKTKLTEKQAEQISKLPRAEPLTHVRRLSDRVVYEVELPGVDEKNITIHKMHNSIEIKAFTKDKSFFKLIPVSLPIMRHYMRDGKLVLELNPEM